MLRRERSARFRSLMILAAVLVPASAWAWQERVDFGTRVHDHAFHRIELANEGCDLVYKLFFDAPSERYAKGSTFRFRARVKLASGKGFTSRIFSNGGPGKRVYSARHGTATEGCWARDPQKPFAVDVDACRGQSCVP